MKIIMPEPNTESWLGGVIDIPIAYLPSYSVFISSTLKHLVNPL